MAYSLLLVVGPIATGVVFAFAWWIIWGRTSGMKPGFARSFALGAGLILVIGTITLQFLEMPMLLPFDVPLGFQFGYQHFRFVTPLVMGILGLVLLAFPIHKRGGTGSALLSRRTPMTFIRRGWLVAPGIAVALVFILTSIAGNASQPDPETGNYTMYFVDLGGEREMGTSIYGWFYSVPSLILVATMIGLAVMSLFLISRPPFDGNEEEAGMRTVRTRNVLAVTTGALSLHIGQIFASLAGTASIRSYFSTTEGGVSFWTTFAALQPALTAASYVAVALGIAYWCSVALSSIPARRSSRLVTRP